VTAQGIAQSFEAGARPVPEWWKLYRSAGLDALVDEGLRNSPTLAAAEQGLRAEREQLRAQIGSSTQPVIDAGTQASRQRALGVPVGESETGTTTYSTFVGQLQGSYTLDLFGATRFANDVLSRNLDVSAWHFEFARRALAGDIVTAAISAAALHEQVETTERLITLADQQADDT
jgi:outer membrane protein TolC